MPFAKTGGPGFYHDPELVWRGYAEWSATNHKPSKDAIETIDEQWEHDLIMAAELVRYAEFMNVDPVTGGSLNVR